MRALTGGQSGEDCISCCAFEMAAERDELERSGRWVGGGEEAAQLPECAQLGCFACIFGSVSGGFDAREGGIGLRLQA